MPSFYRPQAFIVARYRLHTQILALSPQPPTSNTAAPRLAGRSRETLIQESTVSALHRLGHALILPPQSVDIFPVRASHPNSGPLPSAPHLTPQSVLADRARHQYRRARFQHRITSAMPSSSHSKTFIFCRYQLHTQILPSLWSGNCLTIEKS